MSHVIIRPARPEEGPVLAEIEAICFPPAEAADPETIERRLAAHPELFFVAEEEGRAVGFVCGCATDQPKLPDALYHDTSLHQRDGAYAAVFGLDVLPECRRRGIAEQLMRRFIEEAKACGRKGVILTCKDRLIPYYEKFGYVCYGVADSSHGGAVWNDMKLFFEKNSIK